MAGDDWWDAPSAPTLSRFENGAGERELQRINRELTAIYLERRPVPGKRIVIDVDATDDPTHGQQAFSFYHGYFRQHMFHPPLVFDPARHPILSVHYFGTAPAISDERRAA